MSNTLTIRLSDEEDKWLRAVAKKTGKTRSKIIHEQIELARAPQRFRHLIGYVKNAPKNLSSRKGFSK